MQKKKELNNVHFGQTPENNWLGVVGFKKKKLFNPSTPEMNIRKFSPHQPTHEMNIVQFLAPSPVREAYEYEAVDVQHG